MVTIGQNTANYFRIGNSSGFINICSGGNSIKPICNGPFYSEEQLTFTLFWNCKFGI